MQGVLTGFTVIATVIAVGYVIGRRGYLGQDGRTVLTRLAFNVATPALLFTMLAGADFSVVLSGRLLVTPSPWPPRRDLRRRGPVPPALAGRPDHHRRPVLLLRQRREPGHPIAVYVLGDASLVAPVLLLQQIVVTPLALTVLDLSRPGEPVSAARRLTTPLRNPMAIASLAGVAVAASGLTLPGPLLEPLVLIGNMSVPAVLLAFGYPCTAANGRGAGRTGAHSTCPSP